MRYDTHTNKRDNMASTLTVEDILDVDKFTAEIEEDIEDLNEAMRKQTSRAAYYGMLHAKSKTQSARIDRAVRAVEASLKVNHRALLRKAAEDLAEEEGGKPERITADMVESAVYTDARMLNLTSIQAAAQEVEMVCRVAYDAFRTRRDMLVSLGHLTREQMRSAPLVREAQGTVEEYRKRRESRGSAPVQTPN